MARQTIPIGAPGSIVLGPNARMRWFGLNFTLDSGLVADGGDDAILESIGAGMGTNTNILGVVGFERELTTAWEGSVTALTFQAPTLADLVIPGPTHATSNPMDSTEIYLWRNPAVTVAWITALNALTDAQKDAIVVTLDDGQDVTRTGDGTAIVAHGSLGEATGTATAPQPSITDTVITSTPLHTSAGSLVPDTYGLGETIQFLVTYDEPVLVLGNPRFPMNLGQSPSGGPEYADYDSGSGSTEIIFEWIVSATDEDTNGVFLYGDTDSQNRGVIDLNGGSITSESSGANADLTTLNRGTQSGHRVDGGLTSTRTGDGDPVIAHGSLGEATGTKHDAPARTGDGEPVVAHGSLGEATGTATAPQPILTLADATTTGYDWVVHALLEATVSGVDITVDPVTAIDGDLVVASDLTVDGVERHSPPVQLIRLRRTGVGAFSTYWDNEGSPQYPGAKLFIELFNTEGAVEAVPFEISDTGGGFNNWNLDDENQRDLINGIESGDRFILSIGELTPSGQTGDGTPIVAHGTLGDATGTKRDAPTRTGDGTAVEAHGSLGEAVGRVVVAGTKTGNGTPIAVHGSLGEATGTKHDAETRTGDGTPVVAHGSLGEATGRAVAAGIRTGAGTPIIAHGSLGEATGTARAVVNRTGAGTPIIAHGSLGEATGSGTDKSLSISARAGLPEAIFNLTRPQAGPDELPVVTEYGMFAGIRPTVTEKEIPGEMTALGMCYDGDGRLHVLLENGSVNVYMGLVLDRTWQTNQACDPYEIVFNGDRDEIWVLCRGITVYRHSVSSGEQLGTIATEPGTGDEKGAVMFGDLLYGSFGGSAPFESQVISDDSLVDKRFARNDQDVPDPGQLTTWPAGTATRAPVGNYCVVMEPEGRLTLYMLDRDRRYLSEIRDIEGTWGKWEIVSSDDVFGRRYVVSGSPYQDEEGPRYVNVILTHSTPTDDARVLIGQVVQVGERQELFRVYKAQGHVLTLERYVFGTFDDPGFSWGHGQNVKLVSSVKPVSRNFDYGPYTEWW